MGRERASFRDLERGEGRVSVSGAVAVAVPCSAHLSLSISLSLALTDPSSCPARCLVNAASESALCAAPACRLAMHSRREAT